MIEKCIEIDDKFISMVAMFCKEIGLNDYEFTQVKSNITNGRLFKAEDGSLQGIAGYIIDGSTAFGNFIYVKPEDRDGLLGGKLYHAMEDDAIQQGCKKIKLLIAPERLKLYRNMGFNIKHYIIEKEV